MNTLLLMLNIHILQAGIIPFAGLSVECDIRVDDLSIAKCSGLGTTAGHRSLQMIFARDDSEVGQGDIKRIASSHGRGT
jgi:hypothetical protein